MTGIEAGHLASAAARVQLLPLIVLLIPAHSGSGAT
jgi:hypothetical protein